MAPVKKIPPNVYMAHKKGDVAAIAKYALDKMAMEFPDGTTADNMMSQMKAAASENHKVAKAENEATIKAAKEESERKSALLVAQTAPLDTGAPITQVPPFGAGMMGQAPGAMVDPPGAMVDPPGAITEQPVQMQGGLIQPAPVIGEQPLPPLQPQPTQQPPTLAPGAAADAEAGPRPAPALLQPTDPSKPFDPYMARGLEPGTAAAKARFYDKNGNPLKPDSDPVLPEHIALQENPDYDYRAGEADPFLQGANGVPAQQPSRNMPHGPQKSRGKFRHRQDVTFLIKPESNMAFRPTEILMRRQDLVPHYGEMPPEGVYFGG